MKLHRASISVYLTGMYLFLYIPIIILICYSFNDAHYSLLWHGFSYRWYIELFNDTNLWIAALHTLILGMTAATVATGIGGLIAISLFRYDFLGRQFLFGLIFILILSPDIVMGIALLILLISKCDATLDGDRAVNVIKANSWTARTDLTAEIVTDKLTVFDSQSKVVRNSAVNSSGLDLRVRA